MDVARDRAVRREMVTYPLQMTREEWAELRLPTPLTVEEAQQVAEYVATLAEPAAKQMRRNCRGVLEFDRTEKHPDHRAIVDIYRCSRCGHESVVPSKAALAAARQPAEAGGEGS